MSRSRRHTPIRGNSTRESEKWEKRQIHKRWRSALREALAAGDHDGASYNRNLDMDCGWYWGKDGKQWFAGCADEAKLMRK
jgi:hypothetical protein